MSENSKTEWPDGADGAVDEGFLERWSRRKSTARQGEALPEPAEETASVADDAGELVTADEETSGDDPAGQSDAAAVPELPPIESLHEDSDYSVFMASGVSQDVRQQALRKLFQSPKFNVRDGLDDYDLDYSNPEPLGNIVTAEMRRRMLDGLKRLAGVDEDDEIAAESLAMSSEADEAPEPDEAPTQAEADADDEPPATS